MALPVNLECCRPCHLLQNYQITQPVFVGGCWVLADVCTGSHSALKWMLYNKKKLILHDDKKNYCLNLLNTFVLKECNIIAPLLFFSILSYYCRREFNNILVFLFVCTTIWLTQIIWYDHQIDTSLNKCIVECNYRGLQIFQILCQQGKIIFLRLKIL